MKTITPSSWGYCYKQGKRAVFINRWDEVIKRFNSYENAEKYADKNMNLIDKKIK